jgi:adenylate cyclase
MPDSWPDSPLESARHTKIILVADVVESVRLMEAGELDFIQRWQQFVRHTREQVLPLHEGRMHKSLGDGLMLEFDSAPQGARAALALQDASRRFNAALPPDQHMHLRVGAHVAQFVSDEYDIYGSDVNLTARITTLAGPGEIVVTAQLRDLLTAGLDAEIEDLGECHLKHVKEPVRAFRLGPPGQAPVVHAQADAPQDLRPTIAVIPFEARSNEPENFVVGELIADGVIAQLSRNRDLRVISRLSTTAFRGRTGAIAEVESRLGSPFVLSGSYVCTGGKVLILAELADTRKNEALWAGRIAGAVGDLLEPQSELLNELATAVARALVNAEVQQSLVQPLPRLDSSSLLLGGISLMHRSSTSDFNRSRQVLEALQERHNRSATPFAWLAKWYTMRVIRGISDAPDKDAGRAIEQTRRALDLSPNNALALAIEGYARCQLLGDADAARASLQRAVDLNPNEPMAWLYQSVWSSMWGGSQAAIQEAEHAVQLSPIDPLKYFFDVILASSYVTDRHYDKAIEVAHRSLRSNKDHLPALRVLMTAQGESGALDDAKATLAEILRVAPSFSIQNYMAMGSSNSPLRQRLVAVLRALDAP